MAAIDKVRIVVVGDAGNDQFPFINLINQIKSNLGCCFEGELGLACNFA